MIDSFSDQERIFALMAFTKELIIQSKTSELIELERKLMLSREIENRKRMASQKRVVLKMSPRHLKKNYLPSISTKGSEFQKSIPPGFTPSISNVSPIKKNSPAINQRVRFPDVKLPNRFGYLRPVQTSEDLDLGKLNPLINNGGVREIECDGPDTEIIARGISNPRTNIFLNNEEIQSIFLAFSRVAKIPIQEDIVKIAAGGFILNGVNSNVVGSRFVIKRISNYSFR